MKTVFIIVIIIHGLVHFLGTTKKNDSAAGSKKSGSFWILASTMFLATAWLIIINRPGWWILAWTTVIFSQILIISYWKVAKAGTILNVLILLFSITAFAEYRFNAKVKREIDNMISFPTPTPAILTTEMIKALPHPVQKWLLSSGAVGKEITYQVYLEQKGKIRTQPGDDWMPTEAEQYFTIRRPAFIWKAKVSKNPLVWFSGRDKYENGKGSMLIAAYSTVTIVDGKGEKIDQGSLLRFLGEMCWFPSAAVSPYLKWESIDSFSAKVAMNYGDISANGIYHFDNQGRVKEFTAKRYMGDGESATLKNWHVINTKWKMVNGVAIPVKGEVIWELPSASFSYYQWEIISIKYNH
jgi:hypothetical protein